jgi:hypothetical protein
VIQVLLRRYPVFAELSPTLAMIASATRHPADQRLSVPLTWRRRSALECRANSTRVVSQVCSGRECLRVFQTSESFDSLVRIKERKSTGVDGRTHSKPTTVLAPASVVKKIDHHPTDAEAQETEAEELEKYESGKERE